MENAAKALEIAAGVLLAVMIMTLIAFFMEQLGVWPQEQEKQESAEQLAKFNQEYTVYQKSAMYGVDVISCLNKAKSNNEKYAESERGNAFFTGTKYESDGVGNYYIDVYVRLKEGTYLEERLEIYYLNSDERRVKKYEKLDRDIKMKDAGFTVPTLEEKGYTGFNENSLLEPQTVSLSNSDRYMIGDGGNLVRDELAEKVEDLKGKKYYSLRNDDKKRLESILAYSGENMKQIVTNPNKDTYNVWLQAVWSTALYDFKTKRFKCDYVGYSSVTGRVNEIYFSEI